MGIQNNLKICDSSCLPWKFLWLRNTAWDFWGVLFEALGIFWGFDFSPHSIIIVTWNPEYPPPRPPGLELLSGTVAKNDNYPCLSAIFCRTKLHVHCTFIKMVLRFGSSWCSNIISSSTHIFLLWTLTN